MELRNGKVLNRFARRRFPLERLTDELCLVVFEQMSIHKLSMVARTSKRMRALCIPILYSTVDISWHNRGLVQSFMWPPYEYMMWADTLYATAKRWFHVVQRQMQFLKAILENPGYARFVRDFTWTLHFVEWTKFKWPGSETYKVLEMLTEVRRLDLAFMYSESDPHRYPDPPSLFPKARHVRLLGKAHYPLVTAILHGEKAQLTSLCLDNLQDEGRTEDGRPFNRLSTTETSLDSLHERWPEDGSRDVVLPGPMRRILPQLVDRCSTLKTLSLRKVGQVDGRQVFYSQGDEEVYDEWASFIKAVKPQNLTVEQGKDSRWWLRRIYLPAVSVTTHHMAPMDHRFKERLLPTLMEGWEGLRRLEVRGVSWEVMRTLTLNGVDLIVSEEARACDNGALTC